MAGMNCASRWIATLTILLIVPHTGRAACVGEWGGGGRYAPTIEVLDDDPVRRISPSFFGFNLSLLGVEEFLWDSDAGSVRVELVEWLRRFPGATYRYPGGTLSNYFDWEAAVGPYKRREAQKLADWRLPQPIAFGPEEYLRFVTAADGRGWYVLNLFGRDRRELPLREIVADARALAGRLRPGQEILRWELGNELDRDPINWSAEKYAQRAHAVMAAVREVIPRARFVASLADYDRKGRSASSYNSRVTALLGERISDFALHLYYDGPPGGPPVSRQIEFVCGVIRDLKHVRRAPDARIWITEHARWPPGRVRDPDWSTQWWRTTTLEAALATSELTVAMLDMPEVEGLMLHSLGNLEGPWPLLVKDADGAVIGAGAVFHALAVLREGLLENLLPTRRIAAGRPHAWSGKGLRAVVLRDGARRHYALLAVNRNTQPLPLVLRYPAIARKVFELRQVSLSAADIDARNDADHPARLVPQASVSTIEFDDRGTTEVRLPANSVTAFLWGR